MASPVKIGIGNITDTSFSNFMQVAAALKPGDSTYDKSLQRLIAAGGDDLKGVSDPLEKILSAVSSHVEKNGLSGVLLDRYNRFKEALGAGEEMSHASKLFYESLDFGKKMYETSDVAPSALRGTSTSPSPSTAPASSGPSLDELRKSVDKTAPEEGPRELTEEQKAKLEAYKKKAAEHKLAVENSVNTTKKSIEESGYLYHYAPRSARESILNEGLMGSKAVTADVLDDGIYFFTNPNDAPSAAGILSTTGRMDPDGPGPDLYRVKIEPGMLDDMVIDSKLPIRGDVASAVVLQSKSGSFAAELIGENAHFKSTGEALDLFSKASYDPVSSASAADDLIEPEIVKAVDNPTVEDIDAAKAKGDLIATEAYDHDKAVASSVISDDVVEEPPRAPRRGPGDIGSPSDIRTRPNPKGSDMSSTATGARASTQNANAAASVTANTPNATAPQTPPSSGAPAGRSSRSLLDNAFEAARNVAGGKNNARALGIIGAASLAGLGASAMRRKDSQSEGNNTYLEESRKKLQG